MLLGGTIGELQQKISWGEYILWLKYRLKYGPLSPIRKYDQGAAIIASHVNNIAGGKATPWDFIFYGKDKETLELVDDAKRQESDLQAFIKTLGGGLKIGKRKRG